MQCIEGSLGPISTQLLDLIQQLSFPDKWVTTKKTLTRDFYLQLLEERYRDDVQDAPSLQRMEREESNKHRRQEEHWVALERAHTLKVANAKGAAEVLLSGEMVRPVPPSPAASRHSDREPEGGAGEAADHTPGEKEGRAESSTERAGDGDGQAAGYEGRADEYANGETSVEQVVHSLQTVIEASSFDEADRQDAGTGSVEAEKAAVAVKLPVGIGGTVELEEEALPTQDQPRPVLTAEGEPADLRADTKGSEAPDTVQGKEEDERENVEIGGEVGTSKGTEEPRKQDAEVRKASVIHKWGKIVDELLAIEEDKELGDGSVPNLAKLFSKGLENFPRSGTDIAWQVGKGKSPGQVGWDKVREALFRRSFSGPIIK